MEHPENNKNQKYTTFLLMCICSAFSMYITMYFNTYEISHIYFSWTRLYMTLIGVSGMAIIMFLFMRKMYTNKIKNMTIVGVSLLTMGLSTFLVRNQLPINDIAWMKAMIPHHSIAILTSNNANINDPEVQKLANDIIKAQEREIMQMKEMIKRLENQ
ncbi:DUF305 domain-containing protein [Maribacter confluentis]|uniref:DUF305 domain-containing protein n=1 Tax=Maribacter confluentis TaxID=1656093 RepID=A0ABT8RMT5_9FLAO|nr:DUF305 domain-containing protein [Maribacter confluentis]MDO1512208.1 DUF305 domain-containing protein [Maribacter confluentis]